MIAHYTLAPPYNHAPAPVRGSDANVTTRGTLWITRPAHDAGIDDVRDAIAIAQRRNPRTTQAIWLDLVSRKYVVDLTLIAHECSVRGVLLSSAVDVAVLRSQLTDGRYMPRDIAYRLRLLGFDVSAEIADFVERAWRCGRSCRSLTDVLTRYGIGRDTIRRELQHAGIPQPASFCQVIRLIQISVALQRERRSASWLAEQYGFYDASAMRKRFGDVFGTPPSVIRQWLGWEWLLVTALTREGIAPRRRS